MGEKADGVFVTLAKLLIPARCVVCGAVGMERLCTACETRLEAVGNCCVRCGRRRQTTFASPDCGECHGQNLGFARARSCLLYNSVGRELLAEYKFNRRESAGAWLAERIAQHAAPGSPCLFGSDAPQPDSVVPVPIHRDRRRERGFNQAEALAAAVAMALNLPCEPQWLERIRPTPSQVGLSAAQRRTNVRGAFAVPERWRGELAGRCVLLVDDLMTTGATLRACSLALRRGAARAALGLTVFSTAQAVETDKPHA
jgi:ComF family protein